MKTAPRNCRSRLRSLAACRKATSWSTSYRRAQSWARQPSIPFAAKNAVVKWTADKSAKKTAAPAEIAKEAAEQSHRQKEPFVHPVHNLKELLAEAAKYSKVLVAYEEDAKAGEGSILVNTLENLQPGDSLLASVRA